MQLCILKPTTMKKIFILLLLIITQPSLYAQGVKIGGSGNPDTHAILDLDGSAGKGLLLPRVTNTQMNNMNAPDGMIVYNSSNAAIYLRKGNTWQVVAANNNAGGFNLPNTSAHTVDSGYVLDLTNNSYYGVNGGIKGSSSTSGYGVHGSSFTGIGGYFTSSIGAALVTGTGNVGVGTPMPNVKLHTVSNTQDLLQLENTTTLNSGQNTRMLYKTGNYYTGGIGTTGTSVAGARMSFFSGVAIAPGSLSERMSILHGGNVGINNINPAARLDVAGKIKATAQYGDDAALELSGAIKVSGTNKAAFVLTATAGDIASNGHKLIIDHPLSNNDPNAILFVTGRNIQDFTMNYDPGIGKWYLYTDQKKSEGYYDIRYKDWNNTNNMVTVEMLPVYYLFATGQKFNILIIKQAQ
jgi:hypothetical protein